jgi:hypothetical protein
MIRRLFPKRPELFAPYSPTADVTIQQVGYEVHRWGRRLLTLVGLLGLFGTAASYSGWKWFGPSARFDSLQADITFLQQASASTLSVVRDSVIATSKRVDSVERDGHATLYIACELLRRSQPRAVTLDECREAERSRKER